MKKALLPLLLLLASLPAGAASLLDKVGIDTVGIARTTGLSKFEGSAGLRLSYDLTPRLGFILEADGSDTHGTLVESTLAAVKLSLPIANWPVKPYLLGGAGFRFPGNEEHFTGGGGLEASYKALRFFVEASAEKGVKSDTAGKFLGGIGFRF